MPHYRNARRGMRRSGVEEENDLKELDAVISFLKECEK
jgi:hypothetical protein